MAAPLILDPLAALPDPSAAPTLVCVVAPVFGLSYAETGTQRAYYRFVAAQYSGGSLTAKLKWYATATSGAVVWEFAIAAAQTSQSMEALDYDTAVSVTTTVNTTSKAPNTSVATIPYVDGLVEGAEFYLRVSRIPGDVNDNMTGAAIHTLGSLTYPNT